MVWFTCKLPPDRRMAQQLLQIKKYSSSVKAFSAVFFDAYFFESVLQILMIVTMMLITVTTILTRVIAISIIKFALFQISHSHPSKRLKVLRLHLAKSQPPTESRWRNRNISNIYSCCNDFFCALTESEYNNFHNM